MSIFNIALPHGFVLRCDFRSNHYELEDRHSSRRHSVPPPEYCRDLDDWASYVENIANVPRGYFHQVLQTEMRNGKYRQARAAVSGGATAGPSASARGANANASSQARSVISAYESGAISYPELCSALDAIDKMTVPASYAGGMGMPGYSSSMALARAQYMQAQMQLLSKASVAAPHNPTDLKSEGIRAGEIIAWRAWNIRGDDLMSVVADGKPWSINQPMQGDAAAGYGVHAYKAPHGPLLDSYVEKGSSTLWVIGEVALWGDIIEHEEGYRAEFARVHSLVTWHDRVTKEQRERISAAYLTAPAFKLDDAA